MIEKLKTFNVSLLVEVMPDIISRLIEPPLLLSNTQPVCITDLVNVATGINNLFGTVIDIPSVNITRAHSGLRAVPTSDVVKSGYDIISSCMKLIYSMMETDSVGVKEINLKIIKGLLLKWYVELNDLLNSYDYTRSVN